MTNKKNRKLLRQHNTCPNFDSECPHSHHPLWTSKLDCKPPINRLQKHFDFFSGDSLSGKQSTSPCTCTLLLSNVHHPFYRRRKKTENRNSLTNVRFSCDAHSPAILNFAGGFHPSSGCLQLALLGFAQGPRRTGNLAASRGPRPRNLNHTPAKLFETA